MVSVLQINGIRAIPHYPFNGKALLENYTLVFGYCLHIFLLANIGIIYDISKFIFTPVDTRDPHLFYQGSSGYDIA
jgi:hypothetical protein